MINYNCIRSILQYLLNNTDIIKDCDNKYYYKEISLKSVVDNFKGIYSTKDVLESILTLQECGYILSDKIDFMSPKILYSYNIYRVKYTGQKFYESIASEDTWNKTLNIAKQIGNMSFDIIQSIAQNISITKSADLLKHIIP